MILNRIIAREVLDITQLCCFITDEETRIRCIYTVTVVPLSLFIID